MKIRLLGTTAVLMSGLLVGCAGNDMNNQPEDVNYQPTRYNENMNYDNQRDMYMNDENDPNQRDQPRIGKPYNAEDGNGTKERRD
ncbi:hypothetical protein LCM20_15780 [Halobacillus litoralis]|uniref:hypothetical protein n=1 Tax=Halobacillus litoralis TaxID=45668 RepID=UPI001CD5BAB6|nr:hypothetical protein [Halobacillus litoralis]MCA0972067.1 hypothetical protein [Halobacillus litoralis]